MVFEVENYFKENNLLEILKDWSRIFNLDEFAFYLSPDNNKVLARKGANSVYILDTAGSKENFTVILNLNANSKMAPSLVLFPLQRMKEGIVEKAPQKLVSWKIY